LKSDSTFAQAYTGLAIARVNYYWQDVYTKMIFSESEMKIAGDSVISLVDKAFNYNKQLEEVYLVRGWYSGNVDIKIKEFRKALEINPNYGLAYSNIAFWLFWVKNERIDAIKYKLKSIELERGPLLQEFLHDLGYFYEFLGFYENAIDIYNQIFQLTNDTLQYFVNMSGPYYASENWEESIRWAEKILEKDPNNYWAHYQLACIYLYLGKDDLLSYHAERSEALNFYTPDIELHKGIALWKRGDKMKANAIFDKLVDFSDKLLKSNIDTDTNFWILAAIFSLRGEQKRAMEYFNKISINGFITGASILDLEKNPCFNNIRSNERFQEILNTAKSNYQKEHEKVRIWLEENNLLKI
jgi:tetratricopeptide (TPR) repeat protein